MPAQKGTKTLIVLAYTTAFWVILPFSLWSLSSWFDDLLSWQRTPAPLGWLLLVLALAFMVWSMLQLWQWGKGLPISALPPKQLVTKGAYAFVRHPIYLGFQVALFGLGLASGSRAMILLVAPGFLPCWLLYAWAEERHLLGRFGVSYQRYQRRVGMLPRPWYRLAWLAARLLLKVRSEGNTNLKGPCVLIANHSCYLDPFLLMACFDRPIRFLITAEAYRHRALHRVLDWAGMVPVRRYRVDMLASRSVLEHLNAGEIVGIFPEGERSPLGCYQGSLLAPANILARLNVPVVPIGITGAYDSGPRWSDILRRRAVTLRVGSPIVFTEKTAQMAVDTALRELLEKEVRVHLKGLPRDKLYRVLWACPRCLQEAHWHPEKLTCENCGAYYVNTADGLFHDEQGNAYSMAQLGRSLFSAAGGLATLSAVAKGYRERDMYGRIHALTPIPGGRLTVNRQGLFFDGLSLPLKTIRSVSTERADTLQVATDQAMWQFRPEGLSVFRLKAALDTWRNPAVDDFNQEPASSVNQARS